MGIFIYCLMCTEEATFALCELYLICVQVYKEHYALSCSFMGCAARFRSEGALNVHVACHNVEDMAFTCQHCQQQFPAWKPLRLHLWKIHSIDADLFQVNVSDVSR